MYQFRREDNGETVEVDFETNMSQDRAGFITLPDGVRARRVNDFVSRPREVEPGNANQTPPVSDNLGFTVLQLAEFEYDRVKCGIQGVEFKPDPLCKEFIQVHFSSHAARDAYIRHRGKVDKNHTSGAFLDAKMLKDAAERIKFQFCGK
jgi:hypothetical protein